ncbi:MAG: class I SAM-dependent methyltransferase [Anaerolineae bacterium]|nr:class I SAM-dependent methyltransferase [Anaerolineae bacterium]
MDFETNLNEIRDYFHHKLTSYGASPQGADWNSDEAQQTRFDQLLKIIPDPHQSFSLLDYGCGYAAVLDYIEKKGYACNRFIGYDILDSMVIKAQQLHPNHPYAIFTTSIDEIPCVDYAIASGVFNIRLQAGYEEWTSYTLQCLSKLNQLTHKGFAANFLTSYSDPERMRPDLYYANPCFLFDYCKRNFSKDVALLHDYHLYDFTILVRKFA